MLINRRYSTLWRVVLIAFVLVSFYYALVRHTRTFSKIHYKPNYIEPFQCPVEVENSPKLRRKLAYSGFKSTKIEERILIIKGWESDKGYHRIVDHLNYLKLPTRVETLLNNSSSLLLQLGNIGRFSLIIFTDYSTFENLQENTKFLLHEYAKTFHVGIIYFVSAKCEILSCDPNQQATKLNFNPKSPIPFIARTSISINVDNLDLADWTLLSPNIDWQSVLEAEDENGDIKGVILHRKSAVEEVLIGHDLTTWPIILAFNDIIGYFLNNSIAGDLKRYIQIDIDDIFVAQAGTRLIKDDISALIKTQNNLRLLIEDFSFTLGFSGYYFRNGDALEIEGDEQLILDSKSFLWFPHTWRHNHVHEYSAYNLTALMQLNKEFAKDMRLNVSLNYAVSPQHSGVYPIHDALYDSWKSIWDVQVTSTEEHPHFAPASKRRGFIYKNISVLPRQTCGLFTHTMYFHALPEGLKSHQDSMFGGSLFRSLLLNQFSIFMTHQQNFGSDRLGSYTFLNALNFLTCYTNLEFKWLRPVELASKYFERFPKERKLLYTDICSDTRHLRSLPFDQTCHNISKLPNVIIVGPQKTGTTALREFLLLHPNVSSNRDVGDGYFEEPQFFGRPNYLKGLKWYRELFNTSNQNSSIIFEKTANYFDNPKAPEAIHHLIPDAKIVIILMDPAERAYSWYNHIKAHQDPVALKYSAVDVFSNNIDLGEVRKLRNRCLQPGFYSTHLERWLDYFLPSQLIILDALEIRNEPVKVMNSLIESLQLPKSINYRDILKFDSQKGFFCISKTGNSVKCLGKSKGRKYELMSDELRYLLNRTFEESNKSLVKLLNHYNFKIPSFLR